MQLKKINDINNNLRCQNNRQNIQSCKLKIMTSDWIHIEKLEHKPNK